MADVFRLEISLQIHAVTKLLVIAVRGTKAAVHLRNDRPGMLPISQQILRTASR